MFDTATNFNQPLGNWDVTSVARFNNMFNGASTFDQDISCWCVPNDPRRENFSDASPINAKPNFIPRWNLPCSPILTMDRFSFPFRRRYFDWPRREHNIYC